MTTALEIILKFSLIKLSIFKGDIFSPPEVIISSLILPVIIKFPSTILPKSPDFRKPFDIVSLVASSLL